MFIRHSKFTGDRPDKPSACSPAWSDKSDFVDEHAFVHNYAFVMNPSADEAIETLAPPPKKTRSALFGKCR